MTRTVTAAVNTATLRLLEPLARLLLDARIGIGEFSALARLAYVKAALREAQESGAGRVNVSRIAATTGLTRIEVAALLAEQRGAPPRKQRGRVRAERVLQGWWSDPQFQDRTGAPARLPRKGARRSFAALVKRHSGDSHNTAPILEELLRSQAVREHPDGSLEAISRTCVNVGWDEEGRSWPSTSRHYSTTSRIRTGLGSPNVSYAAIWILTPRG
jgi:predicted component of type VI protein secretion system